MWLFIFGVCLLYLDFILSEPSPNPAPHRFKLKLMLNMGSHAAHFAIVANVVNSHLH